jgi:hypothetical protein
MFIFVWKSTEDTNTTAHAFEHAEEASRYLDNLRFGFFPSFIVAVQQFDEYSSNIATYLGWYEFLDKHYVPKG